LKRVIAYSSRDNQDGTITITESTGQSITSSDLSELFKWLLDDWKPEPDKLFVTWNLGQFTAPLLRKLGIAACRNLADPQYNRTEFFRPFVVFFRYKADTGGLFRIESGPLREDNGRKHRTNEFGCYSLAQFIDRNAPDPGPEQCQRLGTDLVAQLDRAGISPSKLTSPIAAYLSATELPAPKSSEASPEHIMAEDYAEKCSREWRDCFQVGHWDEGESFDYDITSAYAWAATRLPDTRESEFIFSRDYVDGAYDGFLKGRVTIDKNVLVHPIVTELPNGALGTPVGSWDTHLTLGEVRFIERHNIGRFDLVDGWFIKSSGRPPLADLMHALYNRRKEAERERETALAQFLKGVANGFVGKFLEKYDRLYTLPDGSKTNVGEYYNATWHAMVTSAVRLRLGSFIYQHRAQENVIGVNTDGCLLDKRVSTVATPELGDWRLTGSPPVIVVSPQRVMHGHKRPQGMTYDMLVQLIAENPDEMEYVERGERYVTLTEAVDAGDIAAVGELATRGRGLLLPAIGEGQTRIFPEFPATGAELLANRYRSRPVVL